MSTVPRLLGLALLSVSLAACGGGSSAVGAPAVSGAGQATEDIRFAGVASADAISPTEVVVTWPDALLLPNLNGAQFFRYRIYRAFDPDTVLLDSSLIATTDFGVTSYVDRDLPDYTTIYYRVVAVDVDDRFSLSNRVASARTPTQWAPAEITADDVPNLFQVPMPGQSGTTCLTCHTNPGPGRLDLSTAEGLLRGIGTDQNPDTFVVSYDPEATWVAMITRMSIGLNGLTHLPYLSDPSGLQTIEEPLGIWVGSGTPLIADDQPPVFEFAEISNAGLYHGEFVGGDTVAVTFPHASDPESLPPDGNRAGQLEYAVYAGPTSVEIDWDRPVATLIPNDTEAAQPTMTVHFTWDRSDSLVAVVRATDPSGRANVIPIGFDPATATAEELETVKQHWRNQTPNEREIVIQRQ